jgi:hypothetical protein
MSGKMNPLSSSVKPWLVVLAERSEGFVIAERSEGFVILSEAKALSF